MGLDEVGFELADRAVGPGHHHVVGLGALQVAQRHAHAEHPHPDAAAGLVAPAEVAASAGDDACAGHLVALRDLRDGGSCFLDRAQELVAQDHLGLHLHPALVRVKVRAADRGALDLHENLVGTDLRRLRNLLDAHIVGAVENSCLHGGHRLSLASGRRDRRRTADPMPPRPAWLYVLWPILVPLRGGFSGRDRRRRSNRHRRQTKRLPRASAPRRRRSTPAWAAGARSSWTHTPGTPGTSPATRRAPRSRRYRTRNGSRRSGS